MASFHSTWLKIVSSWPTSAADHCDRLMSWRVPQKEHERVSESGVFSSLERVSGTLCLLYYLTETSHLYSLRYFWRHFCLSSAAAHSDCAFLCRVQIVLLTYLLTQILSTEAGFNIYDRLLTDINVTATFCVEYANKTLICAVLKQRLWQQTENEVSFYLFL